MQWVPLPDNWKETWSYSPLLSSPGNTHTSAHYCTPMERKPNIFILLSQRETVKLNLRSGKLEVLLYVYNDNLSQEIPDRANVLCVSIAGSVPRVQSRWSCLWSQGRCWSWTVGRGDICDWNRCCLFRRPSHPQRTPGQCLRRSAHELRWRANTDSLTKRLTCERHNVKCCSLKKICTCSPEMHCAELLRTMSDLPTALPVEGQVRCWSTAGSHNEHPWNKNTHQQEMITKRWICHSPSRLTVCYTGSMCLCPSHSCLSLSPQCWAFHSRTCQQPSPLKETHHLQS